MANLLATKPLEMILDESAEGGVYTSFHPELAGMRTEVPIPTRLVSNEEFQPLPQTAAQREVEARILADAGRVAAKLGLSRREFLCTSGGMATSFLAMNAVFGRFFNVSAAEAADQSASRELKGGSPFIFDVQFHYVGSAYDPTNSEAERKGAVAKGGLLRLRNRAQQMNPKLASDSGTLEDLSWQNFIKEVFLDSETAIGLISTPPGPYPQEAVVPPKEMTHIRDEINRITQSRRMLAHGLVTPQLGQTDLDFMEMQAETLKIDAWKAYTGSCPKGFEHGWFVDDEKIAYPMLEKARQLGINNIYMELGSTFAQLVTTNPAACAHLLGQIVDAFGADHVLWGTDSTWYGTPQWQIEAFRRFEIPEELIEKHGYAPLTRAVKEQIFGLNSARVFNVDVKAKRNEIPADYLSRIKMSYLEDGADPSHNWYG